MGPSRKCITIIMLDTHGINHTSDHQVTPFDMQADLLDPLDLLGTLTAHSEKLPHNAALHSFAGHLIVVAEVPATMRCSRMVATRQTNDDRDRLMVKPYGEHCVGR
jgi:hypothetical protein